MNMMPPQTCEPPQDSWHARLELGFEVCGGRSSLTSRRHHGPLRVQRPFYPEGAGVCHVYVLHPPGGVVGGDELLIDVAVEAGAHALITTPAAGKFYRSGGAVARQRQTLRVAEAAVLEWLPQPALLKSFSGTSSAETGDFPTDEGGAHNQNHPRE